MTCPGSSVGSEYLTTNQRVGGSSPSQDTIFNTKDFSKRKSKKCWQAGENPVSLYKSPQGGTQGVKRVQEFLTVISFWRTNAEKNCLTRKTPCDTITKPIRKKRWATEAIRRCSLKTKQCRNESSIWFKPDVHQEESWWNIDCELEESLINSATHLHTSALFSRRRQILDVARYVSGLSPR